MKRLRLFLFLLLAFSLTQVNAQENKWKFGFGLGASANTGNVNNCNISNDATLKRNDSIIALDFRYKLIFSALIDEHAGGKKWETNNFEINGSVKMDLFQYGKFSPFLACEMLTNKFKGYDFKVSGLLGLKFRLFTKPDVYDYSISAAVVYDWTDFTDETHLPHNNYRISIRPKFRQKIANNLTLHHQTFFQPSVLKFSDFIFNSKTRLETELTKKLSLNLSFTYEYRSEVPSENYKHSDILTEITLKLKI